MCSMIYHPPHYHYVANSFVFNCVSWWNRISYYSSKLVGPSSWFWQKVKNWGVHLIIELTWLQKFPVVMSSLPFTAWLDWKFWLGVDVRDELSLCLLFPDAQPFLQSNNYNLSKISPRIFFRTGQNLLFFSEPLASIEDNFFKILRPLDREEQSEVRLTVQCNVSWTVTPGDVTAALWDRIPAHNFRHFRKHVVIHVQDLNDNVSLTSFCFK